MACCCKKRIEELEKAMAELKATLDRLSQIRPETIVEQGIKKKPEIVSRAVAASLQNRTVTGQAIRANVIR